MQTTQELVHDGRIDVQRPTPVPERDRDDHAAPTERRLERPDGTIAFDDEGAGPPVVMLPGLGDVRQQYRFLAPALVAAGYRALRVDLRGHGGSSTGWPDYGSVGAAHDLVALLEELDAGPAVIVGNSFGAAPAVWAAAERPDLVAGLVLIGPFVRRQRMPAAVRLLLRLLMRSPWRVGFWGRFYASLYPSRKPADFDTYRRDLLANLAEPGRLSAVEGMMFRDDSPIEERLGRVRAPALVVMGSADPDFPDPAEEARAVAEVLSGDVAMIDGAGHYPHVEMPEVAGPIIADFVRTVHARR